MIKVSIIIPVYKAPLDYLRDCLDSLVAQTMNECEFIVVSDGASETECSICKEYTVKDSRFKFFKRKHVGVSATRNFGINQAQGEYITFVDADDWIEPETCEVTYHFAKQNDSDMVFWDLIFEELKKDKEMTQFCCQDIEHLSVKEISFFKERIIYNSERALLIPALTVCKLIKLNVIKSNNIKFEANLTRGEDRVFNYQITTRLNNIAYLKKVFYHYNIHILSTEQSFHKHEFVDFLAFIQRLDGLSHQKERTNIANATIGCFFRCISKLYREELGIREIYSELLFLKRQIKMEPFHTLIQEAILPHFSLLAKCEIILMKKGITAFFSLRIVKLFFTHPLKCLYYKLKRPYNGTCSNRN